MAHDVFISYASKDKAVANAACAVLEQRNVRCWIAPRDVQPGQPYGEAIIDAIHDCRVMVLVFSSNANASGHIPKEVERAVSRGVTIIPLRIEDVTPAKSLDYFIGSVHWLDAMTPPLEKHLANLADTIDKIVPGRPPSQSAAPATPITAEPPVAAPAPRLPAPPAEKRAFPQAWIYGGAAVVAVVLLGLLFWRGQRTDQGSQPSPPGEVKPEPSPGPSGESAAISPRLGNADSFRNQGLYERDKRQNYDQAIRDFDQAIRLQPNFPEAFANRGDTYLWKSDFSRAAEDYDQVIRLDPQFAQAYHRRGVIRLLWGQYRPAEEDLNLAIHSNQPNSDRPFDPIWLYLAQIKNGQNGGDDLKANAGNLNLAAWPGPVAKLFLGMATAESVLHAAQASDKQSNNRQHCQAYFFLGEYALFHGQRAAATQFFQQAVATGQTRQFAYLGAKAELARPRN